MKELPYFKFFPSEWQNGEITLETDEVQGVFINVCCYYWQKGCEVSKQMLYKRFANAKQMLDTLIRVNICLINSENLLEIKFLDEQYKKLGGISNKRSKAGKIGGLSRVANAKQKPSNCLANAEHLPIYKKRKEYIISFMNETLSTAYKPAGVATSKLITARLNEGFEVDDFKKVILNMKEKWSGDSKMEQYLRPQTLFGTKFESYLNMNGQHKESEKKNEWSMDDHARYYRLGYPKYQEWCRENEIEERLNEDGSVKTA